MLRRTHVQADDVPDLLDEEIVRTQRERTRTVRLELKSAPDSRDRGLADPRPLGHLRRAPVRRAIGLRLQRQADDRFDSLVDELPVHVGSRCIEKPVDAASDKPFAPGANGLDRHAEICSNVAVKPTFRELQHDTRPLGQRLPNRAPAVVPLQCRPLVCGQHHLVYWTARPLRFFHAGWTDDLPMDSDCCANHGLRTLWQSVKYTLWPTGKQFKRLRGWTARRQHREHHIHTGRTRRQLRMSGATAVNFEQPGDLLRRVSREAAGSLAALKLTRRIIHVEATRSPVARAEQPCSRRNHG